MSKNFSPDELTVRFNNARWFTKVGTGDLPGCRRVNSWREGVSEMKKDSFGNADMESINQLRLSKRGATPEEWTRFCNAYDDAVERSSVHAQDLMTTMSGSVVIPAVAREHVLMHLHNCLTFTMAFCELFGPEVDHLHREELALFLSGYFPCGYDGEYPDGALVVY